MGNGALDCLRCTIVMKSIFMGLLKILCLCKGLTPSNWHSEFTLASVCCEVLSAVLVFYHECISRRKQNHDGIFTAAGTNTVGSVIKFVATLDTYLNELKEIMGMCCLCTVMEIVLVAVMFSCWLCFEEPKRKSYKLKQTA